MFRPNLNSCTISQTDEDIASRLSTSYSNLSWQLLLQTNSSADLMAWERDSDTYAFTHKAIQYQRSALATYQTGHNLYGGPHGGMDNYFMQIKSYFGQTKYDQMIQGFMRSSSLYMDTIRLAEWHIYGSSRIGIYQANLHIASRSVRVESGTETQVNSTTVTLQSYTYFTTERGSKRFELTNHLGNVLAVITDKKVAISSTEVFAYWNAELVSATDYAPFGSPLPERTYQGNEYRFAFNGKEKDVEVSGDGNKIAYELRIFDTRLGKFTSTDPREREYPWQSTYAYFANSPICIIDFRGGGKESTHTDKDGNVLRVYDDGDNGVYKHDDAQNGTDIDKKYIKNPGTSAGGIKMGETVTPLSFADFDLYESTGIVEAAQGAKINFKSTWATDKVNEILNTNPTLLEYAYKARGGEDWDIKAHTPNGNRYYGSLLYGKYASARDAGNFAAGAVAQLSFVPNLISDYGFGTYNKSGNSVPKSLLMITTDIQILRFMPQLGIEIILNRADSGEDKLSKEGIEAGKSFIKNK